MNAPKSKEELLREMAAGRQEWDALLERISDADMKPTGVEGVWSIKEVLAHVLSYEQYMSATFADLRSEAANETGALDAYYQTHLSLYRAQHPDLPERIHEVKGDQVNEVFVAASRYKQVSEVRAMEKQAYQKLEQWVRDYSEEELSKPFTENGNTLLQIVPGQCYMHYRQHIPTIRKWLEAQGKA